MRRRELISLLAGALMAPRALCAHQLQVRFWCKSESGWNMMEGMPRLIPVEELFKGRHFDQEIVVLNVRWYVT